MSVVSGTTRELACLTLGHNDADEPACTASDEDLVRQLVEEVQALRVAAGIVEETEVDRQERAEVLRQAIGPYAHRQRAERLLDVLAGEGWTLHRVRRP